MAAAGSAVDITDGQFRLDAKVLADVLCQEAIRYKQVAVVGIAGPMRTGKSFAMSFLMRFLRNEGWRDPTWIGDSDTRANDGIEWKGGKHPNTKGILIWNEVFLVEKDDGDEMALLLVDTQGLFDRTMTRENNMRLLTFTVLLCSRLILNIKNEINERELGYLQFFTQYAKTVLQKSEEENPFQDLVFLVRDWQNPDDDPYGLEGGCAYLSGVLEETGNGELDCVRRDLRSAFGDIQSFLMPHPGNNVVTRKFEGRNSDLDPEFLRCIKDLANVIFDPSVLKERIHNGKALTGEDLWHLLKYSNDAFQKGSAPEVKNMVEAFARMKNRLACEDGLELFKRKFRENTEGKDLDGIYREAQRESLQFYEKNTRLGSEDFREEYRKRLILECQDEFKRISAWDELRKLKAKNSSMQELDKRWRRYKDAMQLDMKDRSVSEVDIAKLHSKHSRAIFLEYQNETAENSSFHEEHLALLKDLTEVSYYKLKAVNEERLMLQTLRSQEDLRKEYKAYHLLHKVAQQYRKEFEKYSALYIQEKEFKEQIGPIQQSYRNLLSENWDGKGPNIGAFRDTFSRLLEEEFQDGLKQNVRNKEVLYDIIEECSMTMRVQYQEKMHRIVEKYYCDPADLRKAHQEIVGMLLVDLTHSLRNLEASEKTQILENAKRDFLSKFAYFAETNEANRQEKPPTNWGAVHALVTQGIQVAVAASFAVRQCRSVLQTIKWTYGAIKTVYSAVILPSAEVLVTMTPELTLTAGAVATASVVAYCVYKNQENPQVGNKQSHVGKGE